MLKKSVKYLAKKNIIKANFLPVERRNNILLVVIYYLMNMLILWAKNVLKILQIHKNNY